ncbi:MAG: hypothetical protein H6686_08370 [Fibrobacteria bacterium]|nr:hypothetical protein [Fibrobacteria bacterium]
MTPSLLRTLALALAAAACSSRAATISGTVTDLAGSPLADMRVALLPAGGSTWADQEGRWTLGGESSLSTRGPRIGVHPTRNLVLERGVLRFSPRGMDLLGRRSIAMASGRRGEEIFSAVPATRSAVDTPDSIYFVHAGRVLGRFPAPLLDSSFGAIALDTASSGRGAPWNPAVPYESVRDGRDGRVYRTVKVGDAVWMAENFDLAIPGRDIPWAGGEVDTGLKYGRHYDWATVMALPDSCLEVYCQDQISIPHRGICPLGWHVPSAAEWDSLSMRTGTSSISGRTLKALSGWSEDKGGSDTAGFRALGAGRRDPDGAFRYIGKEAYWWTTNETFRTDSEYRNISWDQNWLFYNKAKNDGFSLRCVQD